MKVAYFEPDATKHQIVSYGEKQDLIVSAPPTVDDYQFKSVLNFNPDLKILKEQGFREWICFDHLEIDFYLDGGKEKEKADNKWKSGNDPSSRVQAAIADRKNLLGKLKTEKGINSGEDVKRIYLKLKYESFVQGYLCYFEYNTSSYTSKSQTDCRTLYFDWGILDPNFGLTIFLNPVMNPGGYDLKSSKYIGNQNSTPASASSETDPQQPPPPPPPTRNDSV